MAQIALVALATIALCWPQLPTASAAGTPPNIIFIVADDLGFNDISQHGSPQIPTPNIDEIATTGTLLARYYTQPVCSPTRASILSARHVIHTGIYMPFDHGVTNEHLNVSYTLLPSYLKRCCGYATHAVGKWHLGANTVNATPIGRGFDTHLGYWSGAEDYETHMVAGAYDFVDQLSPAVKYNNTFSTTVFAEQAVSIILAQGAMGPTAPPLFLYLAFQNVHWPLEAPPEYIARFAHVPGDRRLVCAMAAFLDDAVGNVTGALKTAGLWDKSVVVFVSDNGGPTNGNEGTWSNNFPLRGGKNTLWEGGVRGVGLVRGPGVPVGAVNRAHVHATDWLPSLVSLATGGEDFRRWAAADEPPYQPGDGMDVWQSIVGGPAQRTWVLLETHAAGQPTVHGDGLVLGDMKLVGYGATMPQDENGWFAPPGQDAATTRYTVVCRDAAGGGPRTGAAPSPQACQRTKPCLFNITADPCEYHDLAGSQPALLAQLQAQLHTFAATAVPPLKGTGCQPRLVTVAGTAGPTQAFQPCDAPVEGW